VISPYKIKDGTDFNYNGVDYKGGTFIIPVKYRSAAVNARIAYWQTQGVIGSTTPTSFLVDVNYSLKYTPRWTFDFQNGNIAISFLDDAGIPSAGYPKKYPNELDPCDDLFVMPHADPTWATHSNLYFWNQANDGWIWAGCHAVSVLENLYNPAIPSQKMNFLSQDGLVPYGSHSNATPPYTYTNPIDPEMQFMGTTEAAQQNGSEQIFLPQINTWRPSTTATAYDPTQVNVPSLSPGVAAAIIYGRAFGVNSNGKVMYVGGHNINKGNASAVAAIRNFFNFSFLSVYDKQINFLILGNISLISLNNYTYRASLPVNINPNLYAYQWESTCGGVFSNPTDSVTLFTAPNVASCTNCILYCTITDTCGRQYYQDYDITICPGSTLGVGITNFNGNKSGNDNLLNWNAITGSTERFEVEYSIDGSTYINIATVFAQQGNGDVKNYSFTHTQPPAKVSWYRLKIINADGSFKYSDAIIIRDELKYIVYPAYPNPFDQQTTISIDAESNKTLQLYLADVTGKTLVNKTVTLRKGNNKIELDQLGVLSPGTYFIRISDETIISKMQLIKK
jgi:hypothetical protein